MKYKLSDLTVDGKGTYGIAASAVDYDSQKPTYLRITDINDDGTINFDGLKSVDDENSYKYILKENDIVFARTGASTGRSYFYQKEDGVFVYAGFLIKFSLDPQKVNPRYLKYYTHSKMYYDWVHSFDSGATRGNINAKTFGDMLLDLPERNVQDEIVSILKEIDDKIAVNRRICENLEAQAQALFKHWFIDFAPFKNGKFVESELVGTLEELIDIKYGKDHKKLNEGNIPAYGSAGLMRTVDEKLYYGESVLIPRKGTLNNILYVNEAFWTVDTMFYTIPKKSNILKYLYMKLKRIDFNKMNVGTSIPSNSTSQLNKLKIVVPTDEILSRFDGIMSSLLQEIMHSQKESKGLATLRDALLPKLMSGQIKVNEMEKSL